MSWLHFHAVAESPKIVDALAGQAENALWPFQRFLKQAIKTAEQRQTRYHLPWSRVLERHKIQPRPLDTILRISKPQRGWIVTGWPEDRAPDLSRPLLDLDTDDRLNVVSVSRAGSRLIIHIAGEVAPDHEYSWARERVRLTREDAPIPPSSLHAPEGKPYVLRSRIELLGERHWRVVVEGACTPERILGDGVELECSPISEEVRNLRSESGDYVLEAAGTWPIGVEELPPCDTLLGDNGVRYAWTAEGGRRDKQIWIELRLPDTLEADELLDPRAAFCEDQVEEVWTAERKHKGEVLKVKRVDRERYRLAVDRLPDQGKELYLPLDVRNLQLQRRAMRQLAEEPLPHHRGLLRLTEDPERVRWPSPVSDPVSQWHFLTDDTRDGTIEQREFVWKALATRDFAFLEGPPGSGKTTAICEVIRQLVERGQRILLCASTHVAVDNVIERLLEDRHSPVVPVRVGKVDRVDEAVQSCQLDRRIESVREALASSTDFRGLAGPDLDEVAERLVLMSANLTCGTTMGIVSHPCFRGQNTDMKQSERPITDWPQWDVLIIDEASKTLVQEFMVPALMAKKWIVVGDVRQLPPFADRADLVANLRNLLDDDEKPLFTEEHQRVCLIVNRLSREEVAQCGAKWAIVAPGVVLDHIEAEAGKLAAGRADGPTPNVLRLRDARGGGSGVAIEAFLSGQTDSLRCWVADWLLIPTDAWPRVAHLIPPAFLWLGAPDRGEYTLPPDASARFRNQFATAHMGRLAQGYRERKDEFQTHVDAQDHECEWLSEHDWAGEVAWRLTRFHELRGSRNQRVRERVSMELARILPSTTDVTARISELQDIGLPSILETVQQGIGEERAQRRSSLTMGMRVTRPRDFEDRFVSLSYQHRMNPGISDLPRELFYDESSLRDANTIQSRDARLGWRWTPYPARRVWANVEGQESAGVNQDEIRYIEEQLRQFLDWARSAPRPPRGRINGIWEVACLTFYVKQERALSAMLQDLTGEKSRKARFPVSDSPVEIVCGTVDRFQGREADLVFLSLRNTRRVGFMDSPNRLNVAITRARQQLVIVGNASYFRKCKTEELEELAKRTEHVEAASARRRRTT